MPTNTREGFVQFNQLSFLHIRRGKKNECILSTVPYTREGFLELGQLKFPSHKEREYEERGLFLKAPTLYRDVHYITTNSKFPSHQEREKEVKAY